MNNQEQYCAAPQMIHDRKLTPAENRERHRLSSSYGEWRGTVVNQIFVVSYIFKNWQFLKM